MAQVRLNSPSSRIPEIEAQELQPQGTREALCAR